MSLKLLEEAEADDPILSVVNLIGVFLVIIAALPLVANTPMILPGVSTDTSIFFPS